MRLRLCALGHRMPGWVADAYADYARRLPRDHALELVELKPAPRDRGRTVVQLLAAEGERIASADSNRQVKALAQHVRDKLKEAGATIIGVEGEETAEWVLVDAGDIVVHVMQPAVRTYYNLEELWAPPRTRAVRAA